MAKKPKWWNLSHRKQRKCQVCRRKMKKKDRGRAHYWCGKRKGLW